MASRISRNGYVFDNSDPARVPVIVYDDREAIAEAISRALGVFFANPRGGVTVKPAS